MLCAPTPNGVYINPSRKPSQTNELGEGSGWNALMGPQPATIAVKRSCYIVELKPLTCSMNARNFG
jgi:hypothetical protein